MQISLLTVVTFLHVLVSASAESTFIRGGSANSNKDANNNPRSLALSECNDSTTVVYKGKTCDWITKNELNMGKKCNKSSSLGRVYDLCPVSCAKVDLGPCTTSNASIEFLEGIIVEKDSIIATNEATIKSLEEIIESLIAELSLKDDTTDTPNDAPSPAETPIFDSQCEVDSYLLLPGTTQSRCVRCDGHFGHYGTTTCGNFGATHEDQCKYPIRMCVFDLVKNRMVFAEDIPKLGIYQTNDCYMEALTKGGCGGMFYDPREDCPEAVDSRGVWLRDGFDACTQHKCTWTTSARSPNGPERLCIPA